MGAHGGGGRLGRLIGRVPRNDVYVVRGSWMVVCAIRDSAHAGGLGGGTEHGFGMRSDDDDARTLLAPTTRVLIVREILLKRAHETLCKIVPRRLLVCRHAVPLLAQEPGEVSSGQVGVVKGELGATNTHVDEVD